MSTGQPRLTLVGLVCTVAAVVTFLLSGDAAGLTGQDVNVSAGSVMY